MSSIARKFGLFRNAPNTTLFPVGATIFQEGDKGDAFYLIKTGSVAVESRGRSLAKLGVGKSFGEVALLRDEPRNATVRALEPLEVFILPKSHFDDALERSESLRQQLLDAMFVPSRAPSRVALPRAPSSVVRRPR